MRDDGDARRRHEHEADREQRDRSYVLAQLAKASEERRLVEERGEDADQDDLWRHRHLWHSRSEAEQEPAEHEQDRVWDTQRPGQDQHCGAGREQGEQLQLLLGPELEDHDVGISGPVVRGPLVPRVDAD